MCRSFHAGIGRIQSLNHHVPAAGTQPDRTISSRTYGYDALDRMRWFQKSASTATNPMENGRGESYDYDEAGQLKSAAYEVANPPGTNVANDSFAYGPAGNRTAVNGVTYTFNPSGLNQYATAGPYGTADYGELGNLRALGGFSASYDAQSQMTSGSANGNNVSMSYDAVGRCVKRVVNGAVSYFYYDGWNLIEEENSAGAMQQLYVHGPATDELAALWNASSNSWAWYHYDARGSVTHLTNGSGQLIEQYSYGAWGTPSYYDGGGNLRTTSAFNNRFLFQGRDWIRVLGIYEYRNRMYHPGIGRFLQPDPLSLDAGDANIYRYCNNDPINGSDPLGLDPVTADFYFNSSGWSYSASNERFMNAIFGSGSSFSTSSFSYVASGFGSWWTALFSGGHRQAAPSQSIAYTNVARWTNPSGNWRDPNIAHHIDDTRMHGSEVGTTYMTPPNVTVNPDGSITAESTLDWFVTAEFALTRVSLAEINDHVRNWRVWQTDEWGGGYEAVKNFKYNGRASDAAQSLQTKLHRRWDTQRLNQYSDYDSEQSGRRHTVSRHPELKTPVSQADITNALQSLP